MAVPFYIRKTLDKVGLLDHARSLKYNLLGKNSWDVFKPADPRTEIATLRCFDWLAQRNLLEGTDYFEFGIFRGFNLWFTQAYARSQGIKDMRFIGYDSFFGLPPVEGIDKGGPFYEGGFSSYREEVETYFNRFGVDWEKTKLVQGFFEDSLNQKTIDSYQLRSCALCVVDCDLYSSTVTVLDFVLPFLKDSSIIYFDDWTDFGGGEKKGEPKAFAEFLEKNKETVSAEEFEDFLAIGSKGKAFIIHR